MLDVYYVRCYVPSPVKVSLQKSWLSTAWIPSLPILSPGGETDACTSQRAYQSQKWKISA